MTKTAQEYWAEAGLKTLINLPFLDQKNTQTKLPTGGVRRGVEFEINRKSIRHFFIQFDCSTSFPNTRLAR